MSVGGDVVCMRACVCECESGRMTEYIGFDQLSAGIEMISREYRWRGRDRRTRRGGEEKTKDTLAVFSCSRSRWLS